MTHRITNWKIRRQAAFVLCVWFFFCVSFLLNSFINAQIAGRSLDWSKLPAFPFVQNGMMALLTLPILYYTRLVSNRIESRCWWLLAHLLGAVAVVALQAVGWVLVPRWM